MQTMINSIPMAQENLLEKMAEDQLLSHTPNDEIRDVSAGFAQNKKYPQNRSATFTPPTVRSSCGYYNLSCYRI